MQQQLHGVLDQTIRLRQYPKPDLDNANVGMQHIGDLVMVDSHYMPFKDHTFDSLAFITTFEYYKNPVMVIQEAARVAKYGIARKLLLHPAKDPK